MQPVRIKYDQDARKSFQAGVNKAADAVKKTLGPTPRIALIDQGYGDAKASDDGVMVAESIHLADEFEDMGAAFIRQVTSKMDEVGGDGTTTAAVMAQAMINLICNEKFLPDFSDANQIKKDMQSTLRFVVEKLKEYSRPVTEMVQLEQIATVASLDPIAGQMIAQIIDEIGHKSVITVEHGNELGLVKEVVKGMRFNRGFISPYFITDPDKLEAVVENAVILVTDIKITSSSQIVPILEKLVDLDKRDVVIIAGDISGEALGTLVKNNLSGKLRCFATKAPSYQQHRLDLLQDIAILTNATFISESMNMRLQDTKVEDLGSAKKVFATKNHTTIIEGAGDTEAIQKRADDLELLIKNTINDFEKERLSERVAHLIGGVGIIKIGTYTENEYNTRRQKIEDAINATKAAKEEGVIPGGGATLLRIGEEIKNGSKGAQIIGDGIFFPFNQLCENAGKELSDLAALVLDPVASISTINFLIGEGVVDAFAAGIVDPVKVTRLALENAVEIATTVLSLGTMIVQEKENEPKTS